MSSIDVGRILDGVTRIVVDNRPAIEATRYDISWKADGSPVTASDVFLETTIRDYILAELPDAVFIGEESFTTLDAVGARPIALLDPIDGTENFCSGLPIWGVSFALWQEGEHLGSMLLLPELGQSLRTGQPLTKLRSRITGFSSSFSEDILSQMRDCDESRIMGCAVYNLYNVIRGTFARFSNPKGARSWDLLPGLMLALEHGCDVHLDGVPFDGKFLDPSRKYRVDIHHR
jgi:myo-inositol-1(or 4)-monophosphatase